MEKGTHKKKIRHSVTKIDEKKEEEKKRKTKIAFPCLECFFFCVSPPSAPFRFFISFSLVGWFVCLFVGLLVCLSSCWFLCPFRFSTYGVDFLRLRRSSAPSTRASPSKSLSRILFVYFILYIKKNRSTVFFSP